MHFSRTLLIALEGLGYIGRKPDDCPIPLKDIASALRASPTYLSKILQQLTRAGFLSTVMGPHGGYHLAREPGNITLLDVVTLFDGPSEITAAQAVDKKPRTVIEMLHWCAEPSRDRLARLTVADLAEATGHD
jgi:Rrf2 family protein